MSPTLLCEGGGGGEGREGEKRIKMDVNENIFSHK